MSEVPSPRVRNPGSTSRSARASSVRDWTPSVRKMRVRWASTVWTLMNRACAISRFVLARGGELRDPPLRVRQRRSGRAPAGHATQLRLRALDPDRAPSPSNSGERRLERRPRRRLLARPAADLAEREPGPRRPERQLQAGRIATASSADRIGAVVLALGGQHERVGPERLGERRRRAAPTRPTHDGIERCAAPRRSGPGRRAPRPRARRSSPSGPGGAARVPARPATGPSRSCAPAASPSDRSSVASASARRGPDQGLRRGPVDRLDRRSKARAASTSPRTTARLSRRIVRSW